MNYKKIIVEVSKGMNPYERNGFNGFHANVKDTPEICGEGETRSSAIGMMILSHLEFFQISVNEIGNKSR